MCYELCGPPINGTLEDMADYDAWLASLDDDSEEEEESNTISEREALERFDDFLNEVFEPVKCGFLEWDMSRVLKEMDPTAYREDFNNWLNTEDLKLE